MTPTFSKPFPLLFFFSSNLLKHHSGVKHGDLSSLGRAYLQMKILCRAAHFYKALLSFDEDDINVLLNQIHH